MAVIKAADQISIVDVTDAYSVILTNESHTFMGSTDAAKAGSATTTVVAMVGSEVRPATVNVSEITEKPSGVTVTKDSNATTPTLTISVSTSVTAGGTVKIPVHVGDVTITKEFTFGIAFTGEAGKEGTAGVGVSGVDVEYAMSTSSSSAPTSGWSTTAPTWVNGSYIWSRTVTKYTDGSTDTSGAACITGAQGQTGEQGEKGDKGDAGETGADGAAGKGVKSIVEQYYRSTSSSSLNGGSWSSTYPGWASGYYLWTRSVITYTDDTSVTTTPACVTGAQGQTGEQGEKGETGDAGADAITMNVTSSNGTIFKNSAIETVLTAHVYKAGVELNSTQIAALGTVKWYKDGGTTAVATGTTLTIDSGDVTNKASYTAKLVEE